MAPYALSPIPAPKNRSHVSWITRLFGIRSVPDLGILTTSISGGMDTPTVQRSWGMLGYGPNFQFAEYMKARNHISGVITHFAILLFGIFLAIGPLRRIAKRFVYQPGDGPTKEESKKDRFEYRGIATPDVQTSNPARAFCRASFQGSVYACEYLFHY